MPQIVPTWKEYQALYQNEPFVARKVQLLKLLSKLGDDGLAKGPHTIGYPDEEQEHERFRWLCKTFQRSFGQYARSRSDADKSLSQGAFEVAAKYLDILKGLNYYSLEDVRSLSHLFDALEHVIHPRYCKYSGGFMRGDSFLDEQPCSKYLHELLRVYAENIEPQVKSWCYLAMITDPELVISHALRHPHTLPIALELMIPNISWQFPRDERILSRKIDDNRRFKRLDLNPPLEAKLEGYKTPRRDSLADLAAKDNVSTVELRVAILAAAAQGIDLRSYMVDIPKWIAPADK